MALAGGTRLGPYEILSPIGSGGAGDVYRARDTRLGRDVAVKVIRTDGGPIADQLPRFEREARAVAALNHPNILALHDIGNESGIVYAVMELLEGETLRRRLETAGRLPPQKAIDYAVQIAHGLAAAHERGIVHRDLKPENVFVTREGRVKILDFGLARQAAAPSGEWDSGGTVFTTGSNIVMGTPGYMSPEQVLGQPATVRSDLFAFGVVVREMLTGSHPFMRATPADTATAILREDPPPLARADVAVPASLDRILERCLDKHASERPASAHDIALFLDAVGTSGTESAGGRTVAPVEMRGIRTRLFAISWGLVVLLTASTWAVVRLVGDRAVAAAIDADLARAERVVHRVERDRLATLMLTARLVASFPELKALFATDAPTIRDYLLSYRQRNPEVPLLVAVGPDGRVLARTDEASAAGDADDQLDPLLARPGEPAVVQMRGRLYHAAAAAADAGGNIFGHVVAAIPVDDAFAAALREATQDDLVLLSNHGVLATTLRAGQTPWSSRDEWRRAGGGSERSTDVTIGMQRVAAREVVLAEEPFLSAVVLKPHAEAIEPFRRIENGVVAIGLLFALIAAAGGLWSARALHREYAAAG